MKRYHKEVYFKQSAKDDLKSFTDDLNSKSWKYSLHALDNVKYRSHELGNVLEFIKTLKLNASDIFEYYEEQSIIKACYRIIYDNSSLILVISNDKRLITLYINAFEDKHVTLKKELYSIER